MDVEIPDVHKIKVKTGKYLVPVMLKRENGRFFVGFRYNKTLIADVKSMEGAKWHGFDEPTPRKIWSVDDSEHNRFRFAWMARHDQENSWGNPYADYDKPLVKVPFQRPLYDHQKLMVSHALTRHYCLFACEMGTGKTLAFIEVMEHVDGIVDKNDAWYIGPRSGVVAVGRELHKWDSMVFPRMHTYEKLVTILKHWPDGQPPPRLVCFDESSKIKTPTAQRSQAAAHLAKAIRDYWGPRGYVIEMSGSPAPRTPADWWHQCYVARPGFLKEGNVHKFRQRLCLIEQREAAHGGIYPHIVTWLDDSSKCKECGNNVADPVHRDIHLDSYHMFERSVNEIEKLYMRMTGLVLVQFKKDCLDLPEKLPPEIVQIKPTPELLRAAKLITKTSRRAIEALMRLRELSDGFQYKEEFTGEVEDCAVCYGEGKIKIPVLPDENEFGDIDPTQPLDFDEEMVEKEVICDGCGGSGKIKKKQRVTVEVGSPKDKAFIDDLDEHEDIGRFIVWGGFTGTIDRLVKIAHQHGWATLRVDGRGYEGESALGEFLSSDELLDAMDFSHPNCTELLRKHPRLCYVGQPEAGGMALTLTASPTMAFYSNSFKGEARFQASERHHRAGMDPNRAARTRDYICLPSDLLVIKNLTGKKKLQDMAMGELNAVIDKAMERLDDD